MKRWQYSIANFQKTVVALEGTVRDLRPEIEAWMNTLGADGWEIFAISQQQIAGAAGSATLVITCNCKREITPQQMN